MHQLALFRGDERRRHLLGDFQRHLTLDRTVTLDNGLDGLAVDQLHRVIVALFMPPEVENRSHVSMP